MKRSKKRFLNLFAIIGTFIFLFIVMALPAAAAESYTYNGSNVIAECTTPSVSNGAVTIPSAATGIAATAFDNGTRYYGWDIAHVFPYNVYDSITSVIIPSSVKFIESGAFLGCKNLKTVTIQTYKSAITVASGAFNAGVTVTYTQPEPTTAAPTTTKPVTTTAPPTTTAAPATQSVATQPAATKKSTKTATTQKVTTTAASTTTTTAAADITEESVPLTNKESDDMDVWNAIVQKSTADDDEPSSAVQTASNASQGGNTARYLADASVVAAAFGATLLTYFKFKR